MTPRCPWCNERLPAVLYHADECPFCHNLFCPDCLVGMVLMGDEPISVARHGYGCWLDPHDSTPMTIPFLDRLPAKIIGWALIVAGLAYVLWICIGWVRIPSG